MNYDSDIPTESEDEDITTFYTLDRCYALTINPEDKYQHYSAIREERIQLSRQRLLEVFSDTPKGFHFEFYTEISEPTTGVRGNGCTRVHHHGTIMFTTKSSLIWWLTTKWNCFPGWTSIVCKPIEDKDVWHKYCTKQMWLIQRTPLSNTHNSLLNGRDYDIILKENVKAPDATTIRRGRASGKTRKKTK